MTWYHYLALVALLVCFTSALYHLIRLVRLGAPNQYSRRRGDVKSAMVYSFLGAMNPRKKESAFLHLPTYAAGVLFHIGTFISICLLFLNLSGFTLDGLPWWASIGFLAVSGLSGVGILLKRMTVRRLRAFSNPDDYISNLLVTAFQLSTLAVLLDETFALPYFLCASALLLYFPVGKLKHALYFFAARYHLGLFYGWRGIWPLRRS